MDMEKAVATIIEEEGVLLMVVVVALPVTNIEVEEIGEAGHRNRDPKGGTLKFFNFDPFLLPQTQPDRDVSHVPTVICISYSFSLVLFY